MKRSLLMVLCLSVVSAFAGVYDIEEFSAKDAGTPDDYIVAEFGGTLKVAPADEVETLQEGRLVVRQKFEDPFGESETSYQLYQGGKGDLSSMTALTADGVDYSKLVSAKLYERRGMSADKDVEKVYFDGKAVYAPGLTTAIVFIDGSPVTLKGDAPAAEEEETVAAAVPAASSSDEEECDEYDPDCEDEDEEDYTSYKTSAPVDNTSADDRDYAASDAASDVGDRFGIADEVRFWTAVGLSALAVTSAVIGIVQQSKAGEAQDAYDELSEINDKILSACNTDANPDKCRAVMSEKAGNSDWSLANMQKRMDENKKTHDSYATARNIWFGVAAGAIAGAVVLFVW
ncbi:hypothetical protein [Fibrobacter sp.]|uniref:hypothetical protein n=1 Tax=Fibrobacter sp. TaxID=35828 RepID=UPI0026380EC6|nr:hypothetical protein [Fibrobacter sp.]MDD7497835.1 hypothetical protein [Fibrobacter sp.]MDY5723708.1 hypothetical protein [Fibrobacter sp.]